MNNVVDKVRKLLAKATSSNQNEAQAALLKARELMAKYKVKESDIAGKDDKVNRAVYSEEGFTSAHNEWFVVLAHVIAENHCCGMIWVKAQEQEEKRICFVGLGDDPVAAREIFGYAVRFVHREVENILWNTTEKTDPVRWESSYGMGFANGLAQQYRIQFAGDRQELALALVKPPQVRSYMEQFKETPFEYDKNKSNKIAMLRGFVEGIAFKPRKELPGKGSE